MIPDTVAVRLKDISYRWVGRQTVERIERQTNELIDRQTGG